MAANLAERFGIDDASGKKYSSKDMGFICLNTGSTYLYGKLSLPKFFLEAYGNKLPERVYLHKPSTTMWSGFYDKQNSCISGLEDMIVYYGVKPYHVVALNYKGGSSFDVEIFNSYAVEVDYPFQLVNLERDANKKDSESLEDNWFLNLCDIDIEKFWSCFHYNAYQNLDKTFDLVITHKHLKEKHYTKVLSNDACSQLGLVESMRWIDLGFSSMCKWRIKLKWYNGVCKFNQRWNSFATAAKLRAGDICVLRSTAYCRFFQVAVHEKRTISKYNSSGAEQGKSLMKFYKIVNYDTISTGELELPRIFIENYGHRLSNNVILVMGDGNQFSAKFLSYTKVMYKLLPLVETYSIAENFVVFFDYVGSNTFYLTVYDNKQMDIFNGLRQKLMLADVMEKFKVVIGLENITVPHVVPDRALVPIVGMDDESNLNDDFGGDVVGVDEIRSFTVTLTKSHVDQRCHGVYCPPSLKDIFKAWEKNTISKLHINGKLWNVAVLRNTRMCRFGRGWDKFTFDNQFREGQTLTFAYQEGFHFNVTVSA